MFHLLSLRPKKLLGEYMWPSNFGSNYKVHGGACTRSDIGSCEPFYVEGHFLIPNLINGNLKVPSKNIHGSSLSIPVPLWATFTGAKIVINLWCQGIK